MKKFGVVKWFGGMNNKKGKENDYGFISISKNEDEDIFVRKSNLLCQDLKELDIVWFELKEGKKGKSPAAIKVEKYTEQNKNLFEQTLLELPDDILILTLNLFQDMLVLNGEKVSEAVKERLVVHEEGRKFLSIEFLVNYFKNEFKKTLSMEALLGFKKATNRIGWTRELGQLSEQWKTIEMFYYTKSPHVSLALLPSEIQRQYVSIYAVKDLETLSVKSLENLYKLLNLPVKIPNTKEELISSIEENRGNQESLQLSLEELLANIDSYYHIGILLNHLAEQDIKKQSEIIEYISTLVTKEPKLASGIPSFMKKESMFFQLLTPAEQVNLIWEDKNTSDVSRLVGLTSDEAKVLLFYRMAQEKEYPQPIADALIEHQNDLVVALIFLYRYTIEQNHEKAKMFQEYQTYIIKYFTSFISSDSDEYVLVAGRLFPECRMGRVSFCEGKQWRDEKTAYCPRYKKGCVCEGELSNVGARQRNVYGARISPNEYFDWSQWSLLEYFHFMEIEPSNLGGELQKPKEYVNRMAGWINRTIELKERLKCSHCKTPFKSNLKYSIMLKAVYNQTIFQCIHREAEGAPHDGNTYISHCWSCNEIIDSRDGRHRLENYYLCLECGSANMNSKTFTQADKCPKCGKNEMEKSFHHRRGYECSGCNHTIILPQDYHLTGRPEKIEARKREIQKASEWENSYF